MATDEFPPSGAAALGLPALADVLAAAVAHGASDVHIRAGSPPLVRVDGDLHPLDLAPLTPEGALALVHEALRDPADRAAFDTDREHDLGLTVDGVGRFRVNAYRARGTAAMVLRHVKEVIPGFAELGLPRVARDLALTSTGLVLVCGPTGSGKSTTLAAMIDAINSERRCHILTIEDPIEYLHRDRQATISQRELHTDTHDYGRALRSAMRQDPDIILVGEVRDAQTMRIALQAAETGHLVLATLHARTVVDSVNRIVDLFDADEQRQARASLAESLRGVLCQRLVPAASGTGRVLVLEVAIATPRIRESVIDPDKTASLQDIVADGEFYGMRTFEQDAIRLVLAGTITPEAAEAVVPRIADLHVALKRAGYREGA